MLPTLPPPSPHRYGGYALALVSSVAAFLVRLALDPLLERDAPLPLAVVAVAASAWYGGAGPGLFATVLSLAGGVVLFLRPRVGGPVGLGPEDLLRLGVFALTAILVVALTEAVRRTAGEWRRAERERETAVLEERNRLAREIHDTLAQGLTGIILQLDAAEDVMSLGGYEPGEAQAHLARARALARDSLAEARVSVLALRPAMADAGKGRDLAAALSEHVERMTAGTAVRASLAVTGSPPPGVAPLPAAETDLLRIGLEALTNALKHSGAREVRVGLEHGPAGVCLWVRDDGRGFDTEAGPERLGAGGGSGLGLTAMGERARRMGGRLSVTSSPGAGTEVRVVAPYDASTKEAGR